jgi:protein gp37
VNKQNPGIEWTHPYGRPGFTWNVISGCLHDCRWNMPDGVQAVCYAGTVANRVAQKAYPQGFVHHYWHPERLEEPLRQKEPAGIFLDSMSDLMGRWVPEEQIHQVLDVCARAEQHIFFLLTKNAPRLLKFQFPPNVWVGVSTPPDYFMGKQLSQNQKSNLLRVSLDILSRVKVPVRWVSFEPLSWNVTEVMMGCTFIQWAVIGAASNGKNYYLPNPDHVSGLLSMLDFWNVPVFFKGNLRGCPAAEPWRVDYPPQSIR